MKDAMPLIAAALGIGAAMAFVLAFTTAAGLADATDAVKSDRWKAVAEPPGYGSIRLVSEGGKTSRPGRE